MAEEQQAPSIEQMIAQLGGQVSQLAQSQAAQAQTLRQLAQGTQVAATAAQRAAQAAQPQPNPDQYSRLNEEYLKTLANDPIGLRNAEKAQIANEIALQLRQEMAANISEAERRRHAEELERSIYQQNPQLLSEGPYLQFYLEHLNRSPGSAGMPIEAKVQQAIQWAYENKADREKEIIQSHERSKRDIARASTPGGGSYRDPSSGDAAVEGSPEEANQKRFEVLQGKRQAAMGGGRYIK